MDIYSSVHGICSVFRNLVARYDRRVAGANINTIATMVTYDRVTADLDTIYRLDPETKILSDTSVVGNLKLAVISCTIV